MSTKSSMPESSQAWNLERRQLNHQSLKNQFLLHAERLVRASKLNRQDVVEQEVEFLRGEWEHLHIDLKKLFISYEQSCTPSNLINRDVLGSQFPESEIISLAKQLHQEWLDLRSVHLWVQDGLQFIQYITDLLASTIVDGIAVESQCRSLCNHLHDFPSCHGPI